MRKDVYERYDLLIIDELGYLPISANVFQLINGRYERKSTIITTNIHYQVGENRPSWHGDRRSHFRPPCLSLTRD